MSKKVLSLVLALVMVLGSFSFVSAAKYDDVTGTTYAEAVDRLSLLGILEGYPDGTFKPDGEITRAEFATVAIRAKGLASAAAAAQGLPTGFTDVPGEFWASGVVGTAARLGIVNGVGNGLFAPQAPVKYEEAITMLVRALGYEPSAQAKGGYPYGYLIVANEVGLLDAVKGTQGAPATRGSVAQMTDNALEIEMMIQVGYGTETKWVVSGTEDTDEKYLLDELGFDSVTGRVTDVKSNKKGITVTVEDEDEQKRLGKKSVSIDVPEGFDTYEVEGVETKFWYRDGLVIAKVQQEAKFDAVEVDKDELTLITEDENYEVAKNATLRLDGKKVDQDEFEADYAKIALNDDDEIIWASGYTLDGFILVDEVKDNIAYSYDDFDEVKIKDFTVVKDGKTIGIEGIEEEDLLFFNNDEEFAIVFNKGTEGELDRAYTDGTFRFEGEGYNQTSIGNAVALYFDEGKIGELDADILGEFLDDEATITVYVDFAGDAVLVSGEVSSVGNSSYAVLTSNAETYDGRRGKMVAFDVRNGANEKVEYDVAEKDITEEDIKLEGIKLAELRELKKGTVLKISVDKDGDINTIELPEYFENADKFEIDDSKVKVNKVSYRLQSNTLVFYDETKKVETLGNAKDKFEEVEAGSTIYVEKGRVVAVVGKTDADTDTEEIAGLVTGVKRTSGGKAQFTVKVLGTTERLVTKDKYSQTEVDKFDKDYKNKIAVLEVGEKSREIEDFDLKDGTIITIDKVSGRTIYGENTSKEDVTVELNTKAVIYDAADKFETLNLKDLKSDMVVVVYFEGSSNRFVDYVVVNGEGAETPGEAKGVVTYINDTRIFVDGEKYTINDDTVLKDANGIIAVGGKDIMAKVEDDEVIVVNETLVDIKDNVITIKGSVSNAEATKDVAAAKEALEIVYAEGDSAESVTKDLTLATEDEGVKITWKSSNTGRIVGTGKVAQPSYTTGDTEVTLTATITSTKDGEVKDTKEFTVTVKAKDAENAEKQLEAINEATTVAEMKKALDNATDLSLTNYKGTNAQKLALAQYALELRPEAGYADATSVDAILAEAAEQ